MRWVRGLPHDREIRVGAPAWQAQNLSREPQIGFRARL
jgi:hypothetical protein